MFRALWGRRALVALGAVLALGLALKQITGAAGPGAVATAEVIVDTPGNQLVDGSSAGVESLGWRASVLSELLGTEAAKRRIARDVGVPTGMLSVVAPELNLPTINVSLSEVASKTAAESLAPYVLTTDADGVLPTIGLRAEAPDLHRAARLADAAVSELEAGAVLGPRPDSPRFVIRQVAQINARPASGDPQVIRSIAVGATLFCFWCAAIVLIPAARDWWRRYGAERPAAA